MPPVSIGMPIHVSIFTYASIIASNDPLLSTTRWWTNPLCYYYCSSTTRNDSSSQRDTVPWRRLRDWRLGPRKFLHVFIRIISNMTFSSCIHMKWRNIRITGRIKIIGKSTSIGITRTMMTRNGMMETMMMMMVSDDQKGNPCFIDTNYRWRWWRRLWWRRRLEKTM